MVETKGFPAMGFSSDSMGFCTGGDKGTFFQVGDGGVVDGGCDLCRLSGVGDG
ncbi:hypothetical protein Hanom_Chr16g01438211 [Helianthus anomalus]